MKGNITYANNGSRRSVRRTAWVSDEDAGEVHGVGSRDPKVRESVGGRCAVDRGQERGREHRTAGGARWKGTNAMDLIGLVSFRSRVTTED